jgi:hypothetical protein
MIREERVLKIKKGNDVIKRLNTKRLKAKRLNTKRQNNAYKL